MSRLLRAICVTPMLLCACDGLGQAEREFETMLSMSDGERASYLAIKVYRKCMEPVVKAAESRASSITDEEILTLGNACAVPLDTAAKRLADRPATDWQDNEFYMSLAREEREKWHKENLAGLYWCQFRTCYAI